MPTLVEKHQALGAGLLYAPEARTDPILNKGFFDSPSATLANGLTLVGPSALKGYAAFGFDGTGDYVDTNAKTRTNLCPAPNADGENLGLWNSAGGFWNNASTLSRTAAVAGFDGTHCYRVDATGALHQEGVSTGVQMVKDRTYTFSVYLKGVAGGEKVALGAGGAGPGFKSSPYAILSKTEVTRISVTLTAAATGEGALGLFGPNGSAEHPKAAQSFYFDSCLVEESATLDPYFPTAAQLTSGEAGWAGSAYASVSHLGWGARGTKRTFTGWAKRDTSTEYMMLLSAAGAQSFRVFLGIVGTKAAFYWEPDGTSEGQAVWENVFPSGVLVFWAVVFDDIANTVELFINGVSQGQKATAFTFKPNGSNLQIGTQASGGAYNFDGEMLFPAVFPKALTGAELLSIYQTAVLEVEPSPPTVAVRADPESGRLAYYLRRPDGTEKRIAGDEPEAENVGSNFGFGTVIPGGFGPANIDLTRDPRIDYGDYSVYDEFLAKGPGNEIAYEGYDIEAPGSEDDKVGILATGWGGHLKDQPTFQEIYVDRDLGRWGAVPAARRVLTAATNQHTTDVQQIIDPGAGLPVLEFKLEGAWVSPWVPACEAWYDAGPTARIRHIYFGYKAVTPVSGDFNFILSAYTGLDANISVGLETTGDVFTAAAEGTIAFSPTARNRYGFFIFYYPFSPAGGDGAAFPMHVRNVLVVGNHHLPLSQNNFEGGVLGSDVVADIVRRAAPMLSFTTGGEGSIRPSTYPIPHLIYPEAVTAEEAILQASKYDVPDWGVYEDRQFFWRPAGAGRLWIARQGDPGCSLEDAGKQAEDVFNGVLVQFTDPSGKTFLVGPPGAAGCDYTDATLADLDPTNPLNERNRTRLGKLTIGPTTTLSGATQLGARWLQEELAVSDRGTAAITGFVRDSAGTFEPVWKVRAGDRIRFDDADGRERRIIETKYDHETRKNALTLDSTPHRVEALMEKMEVELQALGVGA